jgi:hypothetical protein
MGFNHELKSLSSPLVIDDEINLSLGIYLTNYLSIHLSIYLFI